MAAVDIAPDGALQGRNARLLELLIEEIRESTSIALHLPMPDDERLRALCHRLIATPSDASSAAHCAASIHVAERTLHRLFARETGMSFAQWREQARLIHALRRIANGDRIIEVALDCGYSSHSAFAAMFRRHFGVAPSSFYR
ncbi:helix-turn-helix transcriptional regulator [Comamonas endophytica]|uniref:helix-turn-helix transcriptional regulator n=1 Tax=Comamonas endophytica TaxID=2949090 RepID=UPI003620F7E7